MGAKRTKKDVANAYQRGFRDGYDQAKMESVSSMFHRKWKLYQIKKLYRRAERG